MMNFALIQRFAPLAGLLNKTVSQITPQEMGAVAVALTGNADAATHFLPVLESLAKSSPDSNALTILGTDAAKNLFDKLHKEAEAVNRTMFCTCPVCDANFETEIQ